VVAAGLIVVAVVVLFLLGFVAPHLSEKEQYRLDKLLVKGAGEARHVPGKVGDWLAKPFTTSRKAADKSSTTGRKVRWKLPF
jgi:hypothetical protein